MSELFIRLIGGLVAAYVIVYLWRFCWRHSNAIFTRVYRQLSRLAVLRTAETVSISDPRALQEILVKEHGTVFTHSPGHLEINNLIFGPGLLGISGATHKLQRKALNPVFTTFHTKSSASKMDAVAQELVDVLASTIKGTNTKEVNILEWCKMATLEIIGQAGFGYTFGAIRGNQSSYVDAMKNFVPTVSPLFRFKVYISWMLRLIPRGLCNQLATLAPSSYVRRLKAMDDTQNKYSRDILESRKAVVSASTDGEFDDILSSLIRSNTNAIQEERLSEDQIRGQISTFIFAGFETTSVSLSQIIHLLAEHPHIQKQLRAELLNAGPDLQDFDKLPYLNAIVRETLRLYPPVPTIDRYASQDWVLPLRYATKDHKQEMYIKKGTRVLVSLSRANRCRETWGDDAEEFHPERWLNPLPRSVYEAKLPGVYSPMMTFAAGPRSCIGYRFAVLELKIVLSRLIKTFQFAPGQPVQWRSYGCISPHVMKKLEDGTTILDPAPTLPLMVFPVH
ncbi:cytochrome P450 [Rhizoctonia solani]|nr:cytochrome P450 [Rhizoctonia solani]